MMATTMKMSFQNVSSRFCNAPTIIQICLTSKRWQTVQGLRYYEQHQSQEKKRLPSSENLNFDISCCCSVEDDKRNVPKCDCFGSLSPLCCGAFVAVLVSRAPW